jgi:hypothetical protein
MPTKSANEIGQGHTQPMHSLMADAAGMRHSRNRMCVFRHGCIVQDGVRWHRVESHGRGAGMPSACGETGEAGARWTQRRLRLQTGRMS